MNPDTLAQEAAAVLSRGLSKIQLVIPRKAGGGARMRVLGGANGVKTLWGEPCCENSEGHTVVYVEAIDLLAWLAAYAGVKVGVAPRAQGGC